MIKDNVSIIVCGCNSYKKLWPGLITSIDKHLHNFTNDIYFTASNTNFNYDTKKYRLHFLNKKLDSKSWSDRVIATINSLETDYFLLLVEDYYLESDADFERLNKCLNYLASNPDVGYIKLSEHKKYLEIARERNIDDYYFERKKANYRISAQAGLWKKSYALKLLRKGEDAWYFEHNASFRSRFYNLQPLTYNTNNDEIIKYFNGKLMEKGKLNKEIAKTIENMDNISFDNFSVDLENFNVRKTSNFSFFRRAYNKIYLLISVYIKIRYF